MLYGGRINDEAVDRLLCGVYASFHGADKSRGGGGGEREMNATRTMAVEAYVDG